MEISHRIKKIRLDNSLSIEKFAALINEKRQRMQDIELMRQKVPQEVLSKVVEDFHINANWLLTGKGRMHSKPEDFNDAPFSLYNKLSDHQRNEVLSVMEEKIRLNHLEMEMKQIKKRFKDT